MRLVIWDDITPIMTTLWCTSWIQKDYCHIKAHWCDRDFETSRVNPGLTFIRFDPLDLWIKDQLGKSSAVCKWACLSHQQNVQTIGTKLLTRVNCSWSLIYGWNQSGLIKAWLSVQWASCQICKVVGCACTGNAGNVFLATDFKGNR